MDSKFVEALKLLRECFDLPSDSNFSIKIEVNNNACEVNVNGEKKIMVKKSEDELSETSDMRESAIIDFVPSATSDSMVSSVKEKKVPIFSTTSDMSETMRNNLSSAKKNKDSVFSATSDMSVTSATSATSDMSETMGSNMPSTTSEVDPKTGGYQKGGKNIFKTLKYSDTSSVMYSEKSNYSNTSANTFVAGKNNYSETSPMEQLGGKVDSDTLNSISELRVRKSNSKRSNLNIDIFKRSQKSGSVNQNTSQKIAELGINSSSTSSICE